MSGVYSVMNLRRGCIFEENPREGDTLRLQRDSLTAVIKAI